MMKYIRSVLVLFVTMLSFNVLSQINPLPTNLSQSNHLVLSLMSKLKVFDDTGYLYNSSRIDYRDNAHSTNPFTDKETKPKKSNNTVLFATLEMLQIPILLTATGLAYKSFDKQFYNIRDGFIPTFHNIYDDYTQYLPAAVMLGLKLGGVESRSSWGKMLTADVFSAGIVALLVNGVKYTASIRRPDNSASNSFPSGHTGTAFLTATMLHKEYGHLSPWYSIGAYSVASLTGMTRIFNNKHWISDVFVGAAIGILSVELGYLLAGVIFKKERNYFEEYQKAYFDKSYRPNFISLYTGVSINHTKYNNHLGGKLDITSGAKMGFEGAWFMNSNWGVGALTTVSSSIVEINTKQIESTLNMINVATGVYYSYPLTPIWRVGAKALAGFNAMYKPAAIFSEWGVNKYNASFHTGASISYFAKQNLGFKLFADYTYLPRFTSSKASNELIFGLSVDVIF